MILFCAHLNTNELSGLNRCMQLGDHHTYTKVWKTLQKYTKPCQMGSVLFCPLWWRDISQQRDWSQHWYQLHHNTCKESNCPSEELVFWNYLAAHSISKMKQFHLTPSSHWWISLCLNCMHWSDDLLVVLILAKTLCSSSPKIMTLPALAQF